MRSINRRVLALCAALLLCVPVLRAPAQQPPCTLEGTCSISATITTAGGSAVISPMAGQNGCSIDVTGTWTGTLAVQASTSWQTAQVVPYGGSTLQTGITTSGLYYASVPAASQFRVIGPTSTGTAVVYVNCSTYQSQIGRLNLDSTLNVTGWEKLGVNTSGTSPPVVVVTQPSPVPTLQPGYVGITGCFVTATSSFCPTTATTQNVTASGTITGNVFSATVPYNTIFTTYAWAGPSGSTNGIGAYTNSVNGIAATGMGVFGGINSLLFNIDQNGNVGFLGFEQAAGYVEAGPTATAPVLSAGDLGASEGASVGLLALGGTTAAAKIDFGKTTAGVSTFTNPNTNGFAFKNTNGTAQLLVQAGQTTVVPPGTAQPFVVSNAANTVANLQVNDAGGIAATTTGSTTLGNVGPAYTSAGAAVSGNWHKVFITGTTSSSTMSCGNFGTVFCATFALTGAARFTTYGGSAVTPPSFACGPGWITGPTYIANLASGQAETTATTNTIYVTSSGASAAFAFTCEGY